MVSVGRTTVGEQDHDLVNGLWVLAEVVPEHIRILQVRLGITLLSMDEVRELGRVPDKENRGIVLRDALNRA
jgi:hypothetical protein